MLDVSLVQISVIERLKTRKVKRRIVKNGDG